MVRSHPGLVGPESGSESGPACFALAAGSA